MATAVAQREEARAVRVGPLGLFRNRVAAVASAVGFIVGMALVGSVTYLPLYLEVVAPSRLRAPGGRGRARSRRPLDLDAPETWLLLRLGGDEPVDLPDELAPQLT